MKRWILIPIFCIMSFFAVRHYHQPSEIVPEPYVHQTWSQFGEYQRLEMLIKGFAIQSIIDVPSCDLMELQKHSLGNRTYLGVADSPLVARGLQAQFGTLAHTFSHFRIEADVLPRADLILAWDKLCTLSEEDVQSTLLQFKKSGAKFLLMRHYPQVEKNHGTVLGSFQPINWNLPPYNFPEPIIHIMEEGEYGPMSLALWSFDTL